MSGGPLRLAPSGPAGRGLGLPGPPPRDPRKPTLADERKHRAARLEVRKTIEAKGHRLTRWHSRPRSFGWVQLSQCDLQQCTLIVQVYHRDGYVSWVVRTDYKAVSSVLASEGAANVPRCKSPMANRSSSETGGGTAP